MPRYVAPMNRRRAAGGLLGLVCLPLVGCASLNSVTVEVSTYGEWPAQRGAGTFAFDRLPSQAAAAAQHQPVEAAAAAALEKAGFRAASSVQSADVLVQVGARMTRTERGPWDDPWWWRGGWVVGPGHRALWVGPRWPYGPGWTAETPRVEREVALLLRDRSSGQPLYEMRARSEGFTSAGEGMLKAMFEAGLSGFPQVRAEPRRVVVRL
jgi:hypothetical protein